MPTLMLFSVVDDRSGVTYQEYHCVRRGRGICTTFPAQRHGAEG